MKIDIPDYNVPFLLPNGLVNPVWYEKLKLVFEKRNLVDLVDVDPASLANGDSPVWNSATEKFEFVAN